MRMHNPPHPGGVLLWQWISPLCISIAQTVKHLGISRKALSEIVNEHTVISPEMAVGLSIALGTNSELWMNMQSSYGLWHVEQQEGAKGRVHHCGVGVLVAFGSVSRKRSAVSTRRGFLRCMAMPSQ